MTASFTPELGIVLSPNLVLAQEIHRAWRQAEKVPAISTAYLHDAPARVAQEHAGGRIDALVMLSLLAMRAQRVRPGLVVTADRIHSPEGFSRLTPLVKSKAIERLDLAVELGTWRERLTPPGSCSGLPMVPLLTISVVSARALAIAAFAARSALRHFSDLDPGTVPPVASLVPKRAQDFLTLKAAVLLAACEHPHCTHGRVAEAIDLGFNSIVLEVAHATDTFSWLGQCLPVSAGESGASQAGAGYDRK